MTEKALAENYFKEPNCPIHLSRVNYSKDVCHDHDLTRKEHYHDFIELVFILSGQAVQVLEGNENKVSAGDVFVLQGNQRHYFKNAETVEIVNLMFKEFNEWSFYAEKLQQLEGFRALFILEPRYRANARYRNMLHLTREELGTIEIILGSMFSEQEQKKEGYEIMLTNRLSELIILLSRHYSTITTTKARSLLRISKVIDYMENHYTENLQVPTLSEMAYMSQRNFMRTFRGATGMPPMQYLKQIRLQKARKLLSEGINSVQDISLQCGFADSNYFIKCFRQAYDITPTKFRARYR